MKKSSEFSKNELRVWYAALQEFPSWIINRAVISQGISQGRFLELGDIYQSCKAEALRQGVLKIPYSPNGTGNDTPKATSTEINTIGQALGLVVNP